MLAALGYFEGARYAAYVDDCRTDSQAWRASEEGKKLTHVGGNSDGGRAHTIFQIHVDGVVFDGQPLSAKRLCEDRAYAAGIALRIARSDPTLCSYSGEDPAGGCPKAERRVRFARQRSGSIRFDSRASAPPSCSTRCSTAASPCESTSRCTASARISEGRRGACA